jgi:CheY-like chemotaxis protein
MAREVVPDLIILDITMPVMTGIEMLKKLMTDDTLKNIAVIMLTAESGRDIVMNIVKLGAKDYIVKPFKGEQLIDRVKLHLDLTPRIDGEMAEVDAKKRGLFSVDNDVVIVTLPEKIKRVVINEIETAVQEKTGQMTAAGVRKLILDISAVQNLNMAAIQLIISIVNHCVRAKLIHHICAVSNQLDSMKGFKETSVVPISTSLEEAKASF